MSLVIFLGLIQQYFRMADRCQNEEVKEKTSKKLAMVASPQRVFMCLEALSPVSSSTSSMSVLPACTVEIHTHCFCHGNYGLRQNMFICKRMFSCAYLGFVTQKTRSYVDKGHFESTLLYLQTFES